MMQRCATIAVLHHVASEVVLGCGSGDILRLATTVFAGSGKRTVIPLALSTRWPLRRRSGAIVVAVP